MSALGSWEASAPQRFKCISIMGSSNGGKATVRSRGGVLSREGPFSEGSTVIILTKITCKNGGSGSLSKICNLTPSTMKSTEVQTLAQFPGARCEIRMRTLIDGRDGVKGSISRVSDSCKELEAQVRSVFRILFLTCSLPAVP